MSNDVDSLDVIIIGGGLAGLTTSALLARSGKAVTLFEHSSREIGGRARTTLPTICYGVIEGGQKGQVVALATNLAINKFFSLGVTNIQNECNNVARRYSALWNMMPPEKKMSEYYLPDTTYAEGRNEILPGFILFEPSNIHIHIFNSYCPSNPSTPATVQSTDNPMNPTLSIYLEILEIKDSTINYHGLCFESIIYHELLHACGDSPTLRKEIHDGVIRHTMVCDEAINNLCKQSGNS